MLTLLGAALLASPATWAAPAAGAPAGQVVGGEVRRWHHLSGANAGDSFGRRVVSTGDLDGDAYDDLMVSATGAEPGGVVKAGTVFVYSGLGGALLFQFDGSETNGLFGLATAAAGDVNADGVPDLILGAPSAAPASLFGAGSAFVHSGADGSLLLRIDGWKTNQGLGETVSGAGDVDADGFDDLLVAAPNEDVGPIWLAGRAYVFSGASGALIREHHGWHTLQKYGLTLSPLDDVDGDGHDDYVMASPNVQNSWCWFGGSVFVYSGRTGERLQRHDGYCEEYLGSSLATIADLDGDGITDLMFGAPRAGPMGQPDLGRIEVHSGATGKLLLSIEGSEPSVPIGDSLADAGDVDGDGYSDIITGYGAATANGILQSGAAFLYSGRDGRRLAALYGSERFHQFGRSVAGLHTPASVGFDRFVIGAFSADFGGLLNSGEVRVIGLDPFLTLDAPELSATSGVPLTAEADFPDTEAGAAYALLASLGGSGPTSLGGVEVPLTADALFLRLLGGWTPPTVPAAHGTLDASGDATILIHGAPPLAAYAGRQVWLAVLSYDPAGPTPRRSSVARRLTVVP